MRWLVPLGDRARGAGEQGGGEKEKQCKREIGVRLDARKAPPAGKGVQAAECPRWEHSCHRMLLPP